MTIQAFEAVLQFWFEEATPQQWWQKDTNFDQLTTQRVSQLHQQACANECDMWRQLDFIY